MDHSDQLSFLSELRSPNAKMRAAFDRANDCVLLVWIDSRTGEILESVNVSSTAFNRLHWGGSRGCVTSMVSGSGIVSIQSALNQLQQEFPFTSLELVEIESGPGSRSSLRTLDPPSGRSAREYLEGEIRAFAIVCDERWNRERKRLNLEKFNAFASLLAGRDRAAAPAKPPRAKNRPGVAWKDGSSKTPPEESAPPPPPVPPVAVAYEAPALRVQDLLMQPTELKSFFLREKAALWWVSNQSDDLLALPYCRIERLEYQVRSALRIIGALRGRALLSDEVGLGKTVEAGLVLKEYLVRGMVRRFLVLTVPSLVDQWEEELDQKFDIRVATTNHPEFRSDPEKFWAANSAIVASLHTVKQAAHLAAVQQAGWDLLIVDEAHYLRNRKSVAWAAVNSIPRKFLLLLTATPVQNSLEELYNLVTLLQPGQLPSPREFNARFMDKKRPHQPKEPEELRRLLGQVMIRNTRANAGIQLPSRRAELVTFEPSADERERWQQYETELRAALNELSASQASLWGRLLLQAAGSSPQAWLRLLDSFPDRTRAKNWRALKPFETSWDKKAELVLPLAKGENGVVIFSQFLETQAALAEAFQRADLPAFVINGQTPAAERHPITETFRKEGGALLLTHSGTEGRNLQFCHRLVNFDLPWNPMEIEQRIGRLHRIGQKQTVRIYNLVQAGSLQEHLLQILQEKLNLFELVVGETGLILGEKFSSEEFAEEVFRRWREPEGTLAQSMAALGDELAAARGAYQEVKELDQTLFSRDYESI